MRSPGPMAFYHPALIDEDLDLSHLFLARSAQPGDEDTDVPIYLDDDTTNDDPRTCWGEIVLADALTGWG